jgi:hypothetical protein
VVGLLIIAMAVGSLYIPIGDHLAGHTHH